MGSLRSIAQRYPVNFNRLLSQLNDIRVAVAIGDPLSVMPKGALGSVSKCPIARALSNGVKADVDGEVIILRFPRNSEHDLDLIVEELRKLGHKDAANISAKSRRKIMFSTTRMMSNFIERFDNNGFESLIEGSN
jgi:hypothetical protein